MVWRSLRYRTSSVLFKAGGMAAGSIVRLKVQNFMTYKSVEVRPCQGLNLITGPNGTGKSTLLCAMCLGLGGKPSHIGRSERVSDFIKNGYNQAYIEIELFNPNAENIVIGRQINDANNSFWTLNGKTSSQKAVDREVARFNIQTNNLCQFLPQEKVSDFTKMNAKELLESTEQAVGDQSMFENHKKLKELTVEYNEAQSTSNNMKENLTREMESNKRLEGQVKQLKERQKHLEKIKLIEQKIPCMKYKKACERMQTKLGEKTATEEKMKVVAEKLEPLKKNVEAAKLEVRKVEKKIDSLDKDIHMKKRNLYDSTGELDKLDSEYKNRKSNIEGKIASETERAAKISNLQCVIASMQQESQDSEAENAKHQVEFDAVKEELRQKVQESSGYCIQSDQSKSALNGLKMTLERTQKSWKKLQLEHEFRLAYLRRREPDVYTAVLWLREHGHLFKKKIYEPILTLLNIPDPHSAKYIENHVAYRDLTAFYAEDPEDMNKFLKILSDDKKLSINGIHAVPVPENQLQPRVKKANLKNFGLTHYLIELFTAPPLVMNYLCKQYGLHNIPIGYQYDGRRIRSILQEPHFPFTKFFVGDYVFKIKVSKYGDRSRSSVSQKINERGLLKGGTETYELKELQQRKQKLESDIDMESQNIKRMTELNRQCEEAIEKLRGRKKELVDKASGLRNLKAKLQAVKEQLRFHTKEVCNIEEQKQKLENLRNESVLQTKVLLISQQTLYEDIFALEKERLWSLLTHNFLARAKDKSEEIYRNASEERHELQETLSRVVSMLNSLKVELQKLKTEANKAINSSDRSASSEIRERFKELPDEMEELENELARERAKLNCLHRANPTILDEYNLREKLIEETKSSIEVKEQDLKDLEEKIKEIRELWLPKIEDLIGEISSNFSRYFASLGCAGEVILDKTDNINNYDKYGLSIQVKFRDHEPLTQLSHAHHSGGECSVSTILFILSLQELTEVPFRVVDEINQGMDNMNERNVFNLIVESSCSKKKSQYFLITPKLLNNLVYPPQMEIAIIFNGLSTVDSWDIDRFVQIQLSKES